MSFRVSAGSKIDTALDYSKYILGMEQRIFCIFIDYATEHRKGFEICNAALVNSQQKLWFHRTKNIFLNATERFKQEKVY